MDVDCGSHAFCILRYAFVFVADFDANVQILVTLFILLGLYITVNSLVGIAGGFKRSLPLLKLCLSMSLLSLFLQVGWLPAPASDASWFHPFCRVIL